MSFNNLNDFNFGLNNNLDQFNQTGLNASNQPTSPSNIPSVAAERFAQIQVTEDRLIEDSELGLYGLTAETEMSVHSEASSSSSSDYMDTTREPSSSSSSSSTTRNSRKRNVQSKVSDIFEGRNPKKRRLDHSQMHTIYEPSPGSSSSTSLNERMQFIPAAPSSSSTSLNERMQFIPAAPSSSSTSLNEGMQFIPAAPSSSSSSSSNEWCNFNPEEGATKILAKIKAGTLDINKKFPNGFKITDNEWEQLEPVLPKSIKNLDYPRGLINAFIELLLHEAISQAYIKNSESIDYISADGNIVSVSLKSINEDMYKIKRLICMKLTRFHGYLSTRYKLFDHTTKYFASPNSLKKKHNPKCDRIVRLFLKKELESLQEVLSTGSKDKKELKSESIQFLIYLGLGGNLEYGVSRFYNTFPTFSKIQKAKEFVDDIVHNTNVLILLDDYIRQKCPDLKEYWMPHLI